MDDSLQLTVRRKEKKESLFERVKSGLFSHASESNAMAEEAEEE